MRSASQVLHAIMGSPAAPGAGDVASFHCWVCGSTATRGQQRWKWSGANFTGQNKARCPPSDYVCESCIVVMAGKPPNTERMYSHFVEGESWLRVNKGQKPAMREFLRREKRAPWFASIADSGQKHIVPWSPVNAPGIRGFVLFEEALIELPDEPGWSLVDDIAQMLTDGATKDEILPGAWTARAYSLLGLERVERFEEAYGSMRGGPWFELAVWLAQRDEEKVAARMEAEKAANAAKKAKAKEATSGNRKGGKGKAQNADGGGNSRPAKRVPAHSGVQRPDALVDDIRQAPSSGEDVGNRRAVVHGDAKRAPVVQSGQEQLGFIF
jgi:hypothetical protein